MDSNEAISKISKIYTIDFIAPQTYPNNVVMDMHEYWAAKMLIRDLLEVIGSFQTSIQ